MSTLFTITGDSPDSESTAVLGELVNGLGRFESLIIDAVLTEATGGSLDIVLQRKVTTDVWADWIHFPQLSAGSDTLHYSVAIARSTGSIVSAAGGTDSVPATTAAANTVVGGIPDDMPVRAVAVAGASTSAGSEQTIYIRGTERAL